MKVFISWSGEPSRRVAQILRSYLPCILQSLNPFMSQHDLASGSRWSEQISRELDTSNFGIVCLTPDNLESAWILFEAGALTKHVEGRTCCLLFRGLGPADVTGPLSQFQHCVFSRDGFKKLLIDINSLQEQPLDLHNLERIFEKWWSDIDKAISEALTLPGTEIATRQRRETGDLLEEILVRVRALAQSLEQEATLDSSQDDVPSIIGESNVDWYGNRRKLEWELLRQIDEGELPNMSAISDRTIRALIRGLINRGYAVATPTGMISLSSVGIKAIESDRRHRQGATLDPLSS